MNTRHLTAAEAYRTRDEWYGKYTLRRGTLRNQRFDVDWRDIRADSSGAMVAVGADGFVDRLLLPGETVRLVPIARDGFDERLNALLTMLDGWEIAALKVLNGEWYCQLTRQDGASVLTMREPTARAAIEAAKKIAAEKDGR